MRHSPTSDTPCPARAAVSSARRMSPRPTKAGGTAGVQGSKGLAGSADGSTDPLTASGAAVSAAVSRRFNCQR